MSDYLSSVLDELVPTFADEDGDWGRVVADAGAETPTDGAPVARRRNRLIRSAPWKTSSPAGAVAHPHAGPSPLPSQPLWPRSSSRQRSVSPIASWD